MGMVNKAEDLKLGKLPYLPQGVAMRKKMLPEADSMNSAARVKVPVLMINRRYDFEIPLETCQEPLFRFLGVSPQDKRHVFFGTGHGPPELPVMKEALNWLDRYLGPVK